MFNCCTLTAQATKSQPGGKPLAGNHGATQLLGAKGHGDIQ